MLRTLYSFVGGKRNNFILPKLIPSSNELS